MIFRRFILCATWTVLGCWESEPAPESATAALEGTAETEVQGDPSDPCSGEPLHIGANRSAGPMTSFEELCRRWGRGNCQELERGGVSGNEAGMFEQAALIRGQAAEEGKTKVGLALETERGWFIHDELTRYDETITDHEFRVHERPEDDTRILVVDIKTERRFEFSPGGPVQVLTRHYQMLCAVGRRERAGCVFLPLAFRRETRRAGEPPSDVSTTEFQHRFCENGNMLYEGSAERLSRENEEIVGPILGLTRLRFP